MIWIASKRFQLSEQLMNITTTLIISSFDTFCIIEILDYPVGIFLGNWEMTVSWTYQSEKTWYDAAPWWRTEGSQDDKNTTRSEREDNTCGKQSRVASDSGPRASSRQPASSPAHCALVWSTRSHSTLGSWKVNTSSQLEQHIWIKFDCFITRVDRQFSVLAGWLGTHRWLGVALSSWCSNHETHYCKCENRFVHYGLACIHSVIKAELKYTWRIVFWPVTMVFFNFSTKNLHQINKSKN